MDKRRDECQICERTQALKKNGVLVNHGYQRPGYGWIVGNCHGVGHQPFPKTTALIEWKLLVENSIKNSETRLIELNDDSLDKVAVPTWKRDEFTGIGRNVNKYYTRTLLDELNSKRNSWERRDWAYYTNCMASKVKANLNQQKFELTRVTNRLAKAATLNEEK